MARIARFTEVPRDRSRIHATEVECEFAVFERGGQTFVQLDTLGSNERQLHGKVSQTIQLDAERAAQLIRILRRAFPQLT